jgi:hypothetical protein
VKLLADIDAFGRNHEKEDRARQAARAGAEALERLARLLAQRVRGYEQRPVRDALEELAEQLRSEAVDEHPDLVRTVVSSERAAVILEGLEEMGLVAGREKIEQRAEQLAQERLVALKAEHGLVV